MCLQSRQGRFLVLAGTPPPPGQAVWGCQPHTQWLRAGLGRAAAMPGACQPPGATSSSPSRAAVLPNNASEPPGPTQQRRPVWLPALRHDEVFYLGYGSNMSPQVLTGRRRVRPQQSMPCYVPGYILSFAVTGFPYSEPGFATILPAPSSHTGSGGPMSSSSWRRHVCACSSTPCLHGVLHRVTQQEWQLIKASEGVLRSEASSVGYQVVEVDCVLYDDITILKAHTLQAAPGSLHTTGRDVQPSARYLSLLQAGGRHHGLDSHYQQWLDSLPAYQPPRGMRATLGALASGAVLLSAASTALPAYVLTRVTGSSSSSSSSQPDAKQQLSQQQQGAALPQRADSETVAAGAADGNGLSQTLSKPPTPEGLVPFLRYYTGSAQQLMWQVHDNLAPWLGSGSSANKSL